MSTPKRDQAADGALFRRFVDSVEDYAMFLLDADGNVTSWNRGAEKLKGYRADEIVGRHFSCFYPAEDAASGKPARELEAAARDGRFEDEGWRIRRDGSRLWASVIITAVRGDDGALLGLGNITRDLSERKAAERELTRVNRFLDSIIESVPAMLFVKDAETLRFVRFNRAGEELLGWKRAELLGKSDHDFFPRSEADFFVAKDREVLAKGSTETILEESIQTAHGQRFLHTRKIPIPGDDGKPAYLLGISQDITELRQAQQELRAAYDSVRELNQRLEQQNQDLERASRAKSDFLAMMSHELRTPLNSIIGFSEVIADETFGPLNEKQVRYIRNVHGSGRHLLGLINDLLDLSKIEAGRMEVVRGLCSMRNLVAESMSTLQPLADGRGVRLVIDPPEAPGLPPVSGDSARIKQVLYNLLSNAIKFTPTGGQVTVACTISPDESNVRTSVKDTGPGIHRDDLVRLFTPFTQLDNARGQGGTGLGLALSRQLVELMRGQIGVDSTPGAGSTFHVDLPFAEMAQPDGGPFIPAPTGEHPLALIVDDDPAARELTAIVLQSNGYSTLMAMTGEEAIAVARVIRPSVITLDVSLPRMDGWDVLRELKGDPRTSQIPVVMVTISSDRRKAFSLGAVEHLVKPVNRQERVEALSRRSFTTKVKQRAVHILAIDDDPQQLELIHAALDPHGFQVRTALSGRSGLVQAQSGPVDLVLLDLVMPDMSGIEVVTALRAVEPTRSVPVLLVTAHQLSEEDRARLNGDIEAVLAKGSLGPDTLLVEVNRVLCR